jgi:N-ethylmaleimide reductase
LLLREQNVAVAAAIQRRAPEAQMAAMTHPIFLPTELGDLHLQNRFVMSPMTRCRADAQHAPTGLVAQYYEQRGSAGLIVTEGIAPSPSGKGYARIPGLWSDAQVDGFREVTRRVHGRGARIFAQLMHTGRVSHPLNMPTGAEPLAPSAVALTNGKMWTDQQQMQDYPTPRAMTLAEIERTLEEHVVAAKNAIRAGFDGVELHGANGYLTEQFLNPHTNLRTDGYGGSVAARTRFALEAVAAMADAIGKQRVGIRLSPCGVASGMSAYPEVDETYERLADELSKLGIAYVHVVDHSAQGAPPVPATLKATIRARFKGKYIAAGGFDLAAAEKAISDGAADLVAFGRPFLSNPDLVDRFAKGHPLATPDMATAFSAGPTGYIDYPSFAAAVG